MGRDGAEDCSEGVKTGLSADPAPSCAPAPRGGEEAASVRLVRVVVVVVVVVVIESVAASVVVVVNVRVVVLELG